MTDKRQATIGHQYPCFAATVKRPARCAPPTEPPRRSARWKAGRRPGQHRRHQQGDRERPRAAGFAHYLLKPVDPARLLALMAAFGSDAGPAQRQSPDDSAMAPLS